MALPAKRRSGLPRKDFAGVGRAFPPENRGARPASQSGTIRSATVRAKKGKR